MKSFLLFVVSLVLILGLVSCSTQNSTTDTKIRVTLDWVPNTNHTGLYIAQSLGYYKDAGLDVEIIQPPDSGPLPLLAAGRSEFAISFQEELASALDIDEPLPVKAIATIIAHNTSGIVSLSSSNINSPKDLEGKTLIAWEAPIIEGMLRDLVENDGGDFSKVNLVYNSVTDAISALQTNADAVWIFYAVDGVAMDVTNIDKNFFYIADEDPIFDYYTPIIVGNNAFLDGNPDKTKAFLEATSKGYQYAVANPDKAADILVKAVPELDYDMILAGQEYLADKYIGDSAKWGEIDDKRWTDFYNWMYNEGITKNNLENSGYTNQYLN